MNAVKAEEASTTFGFSATRLGMDKALEKERTAKVVPSPLSEQSKPKE
jgi:hypothetical protein